MLVVKTSDLILRDPEGERVPWVQRRGMIKGSVARKGEKKVGDPGLSDASYSLHFFEQEAPEE